MFISTLCTLTNFFLLEQSDVFCIFVQSSTVLPDLTCSIPVIILTQFLNPILFSLCCFFSCFPSEAFMLLICGLGEVTVTK